MDKNIYRPKPKDCLSRVAAVTAMLIMVLTFVTSGVSAAKKTENIQEPTVKAGSYVVMSGSTSEVIYARHAERKLPMGSITKFMTAMVVIDNLHDSGELNNKVTIRGDVLVYGDDFAEGESVSVEELLVAMLVGDSNQAAEALAAYSASSRDIFISEMNSKAMELGLMSTQYTNPTGMYDPNHYSTAEESAIVVQAAVRYSKIKEITAYDTKAVRVYGKPDRTKTYTSTNLLISSNKTNEQYKYCKGGIAGILEEPEHFAQYAGIATKNDMQYVVVMLEAKEKYVPFGAKALFCYGDRKATKNTIIKKDKMVGRAKVKGGAVTRVKAYTETKGYAYIPPEGSTDLVQTQVVMTDGLEAPLKAGDKVGEYRIYVADELKGTVDLVIKKDVRKGWFLSRIYISDLSTVIIAAVLAVGLLAVFRIRNINRAKAKRRKAVRQAKIREIAEKQAALDEDRRRRNWTYGKYYDSKDMDDAVNRRR